VLQLDGSTWIWTELDGGSVDVPPGAVAFIPPGFVHAWGVEPGAHMAVHFDLHARPDVHVPDNIRLLSRFVERQPLTYVPRFALRIDEIERPLVIPLVTRLGAPSLWRERLAMLVDLWSRRATSTLEASIRVAEVLGSSFMDLTVKHERHRWGGDERILALVRAIDADDALLVERITVPELAARVHMAETSFRDAFFRTMGCAPRRYLEERRIEHAARALLDTNRAIADISRQVGYPDPYHFSRVFRRVTGLSPRQYRRKAHL
jgi:AraC-like DNA-binding protein